MGDTLFSKETSYLWAVTSINHPNCATCISIVQEAIDLARKYDRKNYYHESYGHGADVHSAYQVLTPGVTLTNTNR